jgi:hypothetical protein
MTASADVAMRRNASHTLQNTIVNVNRVAPYQQCLVIPCMSLAQGWSFHA